MSITRDDFLGRNKRANTAERTLLGAQALEKIRAAVVDIEMLEISPEWELFMQLMTETRERAVAVRTEALERLVDPAVMGTEPMAERKTAYLMANQAVETLDLVMTFPKQIKDLPR